MDSSRTDELIKILNWHQSDFEEKLGLKSGKYTDTNITLSFFLGLSCAIIFYGALILLGDSRITNIFLQRGITPYFIVFFSFWSFAILFVKSRKLSLQQKALGLMIVPQAHNFELTKDRARDILSRMYGLVDDPKKFVLLNRIERALANLKNIGLISDVSEVLRAQAQNDEDHMESSYSIIKGFVWGIPVLGFIGTVLGLSQAIGSFGSVLATSIDGDQLKFSLQTVTSGLSVAFDTTLIALVAALCIQLMITALKKKEEVFLDNCNDYCHANIISKLRLSAPDENQLQ